MALFCANLAAQTTTTYTGTIKDLTNAAVTSGQVTFTLQPGADTTISGVGRFTPQTVTCGINGSGALLNQALSGACVVTNNTALNPAGTYYVVQICPVFACTSKFNTYATGGTIDLTTVVPTPGTLPAFNFVDTFSSQTIGGNKTFSGASIFNGATFGSSTFSSANTFSGVNTFNAIPVFTAGISGTAGQTLALPSTADTLAGIAAPQTFTNKTYDTAAAGNSFLINGLAATANTGTGAVVRGTSPTIATPAISGPTITNATIGIGAITNLAGLQVFNTTTTCTTGAAVGGSCTTAAITLPVGYSDTNYRALCSGLVPTNVPVVLFVTKSNTTFTITIGSLAASAATFTSFDCMVTHN